jgi:DNA polymerase I-like protein with 3'-5' exonuclease and polymerase domains
MQTASRDAAWLFQEGVAAFSSIELNGIRIDTQYLKQHTKDTEEEIAALKKRLYADKMWKRWERKFGTKATLGNRSQLGDLVFGEMGYARRHTLAKRDKSNDEENWRHKPKNDEAAFGNASKEIPFVADYFRWHKLEKMHGTYLLGFQREAVNGRIHPFFDLHKVRTYRSSSSWPNFTNIPNRQYEIAKRIRRCFIPDEGCDLGEFDYGLAEVRSACVYTKDPRLIEDFTTEGKDAHGDTAMELFGVTAEMVKSWTEEQKKKWKGGMRDWSKNRFVFPQFFGSVAFQCAPHIWEAVDSGAMMPDGKMTVKAWLAGQGITELGDCDPEGNIEPGTFVHRVRTVEDGFWNKRFVVYSAWKKRWWNSYLINGYFKSLSGFVFTGIYGRNECWNYPVQSFAFHWLLYAIIVILKEVKKRKMRTKLVGAIHDCVVASIPREERDEFCDLVVEVMTKRVPKHWPEINVDLKTEVELCPEGVSWADKKVAKRAAKGIWEIPK